MALSPAWAMAGQAIHDDEDAHLHLGVHYRVFLNPLLGLPLVPLIVRHRTMPDTGGGYVRSDIIWIDSHGRRLDLPISVTPDNPVTGHLPLGAGCCWARIKVGIDPIPPGGGFPGLPVSGGRAHGDAARAGRRGAQGEAGDARLVVTALVGTDAGDAAVAVGDTEPPTVYASHIERLLVTGSGMLTGISWLPSAMVAAPVLRTLPLPIGPGARYLGRPDGATVAVARVHDGAPQRVGMNDRPWETGPATLPAATAQDEVQRVQRLVPAVTGHLDRLVNDLSAEQWELATSEPVTDELGLTIGSSQRQLLPELLQAALDPGVARWLGLADCHLFTPDFPLVAVYIVDGLFAPNWEGIRQARLAGTLDPAGVFDDPVDAVRALLGLPPSQPVIPGPIGEFPGGFLEVPRELGGRFPVPARRTDAASGPGPFLVQRVVLVAGWPVLARPLPPTLSGPDDLGWLPAPAPAAVRELRLRLDGLLPAGGLASGLAQPADHRPIPRLPDDGGGRQRLLLAHADETVAHPGAGRLSDRQLTAESGYWQVAQSDWFGRWSTAASVEFPAAGEDGTPPRPGPPVPTLSLTTTGPPASGTGRLSGTVRVEVAVPPVASLAPGANLLRRLELTTAGGAEPGTRRHRIPDPAAPPPTLVVEVDGPTLPPAGTGSVTVSAVWVDTAGVSSAASAERTVTVHDPRPPAAVTLPPGLVYTARPDATGRARATLSWTPSSGQTCYRVFGADETTLRAKLAEVAAGQASPGDAGQAPTPAQAQTLLDELTGEAPDRAAVWEANAAILPRRWWRQLTGQPVPAPTSGPVVYHHDVSGSLTCLVLYRVVAVSQAGVESGFTTAPLVVRAVANLMRPTVPQLDVQPVRTAEGRLHAQLTLTVPAGPTPAARYRLRRAASTTDAALMPIVAEGDLPARGSDGRQVLVLTDTGDGPAGARDSLVAWVRYHWRAEVRGGPAPGTGNDADGGLPGEWTTPSPAASAVVAPTEPPSGVEDLAADRVRSGLVRLTFRHPDPLTPGGTTGYLLDVYRQLPGGPLEYWQSIAGQAPPPVGRGTDPARPFRVMDDRTTPPGTAYCIVVTDPIGRSSGPSSLVVAP